MDDKTQPNFDGPPVFLDDIIVSLQKSFSRVSARSEDWNAKNPEAALAYLTGPVKFSLTLKLTPEDDQLFYSTEGGLETTIEGVIAPDVRFKAGEENEG